MEFDAVSVCQRMRDDLVNPTNKLEGGFCMDNLQAVSEEVARLYYQTIVPLKEKIAENKEELITSGNENHYVYWAKKVPGVGNARAYAVRDGSGEVYVAIVTDQASTPDQELLDAVAAYIEEQRPVGAKPMIVAATSISVTVMGTVVLKVGYTIDEVTEVFRQKLASHLLEISFSKKDPNLSYHKVGDILFDVPGISDVSDFTINNGHETISGEFDEFFALEEVELSAS